jgi:hypothetical protein
MWNVPYAVAFWDPVSHRLSLLEAIAMQAIGLLLSGWLAEHSADAVNNLSASQCPSIANVTELGFIHAQTNRGF